MEVSFTVMGPRRLRATISDAPLVGSPFVVHVDP